MTTHQVTTESQRNSGGSAELMRLLLKHATNCSTGGQWLYKLLDSSHAIFPEQSRYFGMVSRWCLRKTHSSYKGDRDHKNTTKLLQRWPTGIDAVCYMAQKARNLNSASSISQKSEQATQATTRAPGFNSHNYGLFL